MPPTQQKTKPGTRRLSDVAKHLVAPTGITSTGWPAVRKTCIEKLGISFDDWQEGAGRLILAKRESGKLAAMIDGVGMSLPRQVGKTYLIGATVFALCVNTPGLLVIWSAHHARTHGETFLAMQSFAKRSKVSSHIRQVFTGSGDEEIRFHNGSRILFGARERGFGRGIPGVDVLIFDEAQILSDRALSNMLATMNTSRFGLALYIGTPPKPEDMSEAFTRMRTSALEGTLHDGAWIEFGAEPGSAHDDRKQWARANPSFPRRTPVESILRLQRKLTPGDFLREGMGIWNEITRQLAVVPVDLWKERKSSGPASETAPDSLAIDRWYDGTTAVAGAWRGEKTHVELVALDIQADTSRVVEWVTKRAGRKIPVLIAADSPAAAMAADLIANKVKVKLVSGPDHARACQGFVNAALEDTMTHASQEQLDTALACAVKLPQGKAGAWVWDRREPDQDISSLVAATLARLGVTADKPRTNRVVMA